MPPLFPRAAGRGTGAGSPQATVAPPQCIVNLESAELSLVIRVWRTAD